MDPMPYVWLGVIVVMAIIEGVTTQMVSIWFVFGALVAFIVSLFGVALPIQLIVFAAVSTVMLVITRPLVKKLCTLKRRIQTLDVISVKLVWLPWRLTTNWV